MLLKLQRRIFTAMVTLCSFMLNEWKFPNQRFMALEKQLHPSDVADFQYHLIGMDFDSFYRESAKICRIYLLKETTTIEDNKRRYDRLRILNYVICTLAGSLLLWTCHTYSLHLRLMSALISIIRAVLML